MRNKRKIKVQRPNTNPTGSNVFFQKKNNCVFASPLKNLYSCLVAKTSQFEKKVIVTFKNKNDEGRAKQCLLWDAKIIKN